MVEVGMSGLAALGDWCSSTDQVPHCALCMFWLTMMYKLCVSNVGQCFGNLCMAPSVWPPILYLSPKKCVSSYIVESLPVNGSMSQSLLWRFCKVCLTWM
ncbi:hypothetical protein GDO81_016369 [Engystomops pustulosus]|uniref:Uncharacterized protein n=1 Tax=Engystomops pustulosus TaxID=76066 RepID=A0AAV7AW08_ENGPU|nr:hypothetical protein GDO81_016369 [Engystomops pustulosus]